MLFNLNIFSCNNCCIENFILYFPLRCPFTTVCGWISHYINSDEATFSNWHTFGEIHHRYSGYLTLKSDSSKIINLRCFELSEQRTLSHMRLICRTMQKLKVAEQPEERRVQIPKVGTSNRRK